MANPITKSKKENWRQYVANLVSSLGWDGTTLTVTGALTVSGAFTSIGIDDNAAGEVFQLDDTAIAVGANTTASYGFHRVATIGSLVLAGSNSLATGGNIILRGATHSTQAIDTLFRANSQTWMVWDESVGDLEILTGVGSKTSALTINASQVAAFAGEVTGTGFTGTLDGVLGGGTPAAATVTTLDTTGAFTSLGIDDNATAIRLALSNTNVVLGEASTNFVIRNASNTRNLTISGGNSSGSGAVIILDGGAHASTGDMAFLNDANTWMLWDESVGDLEILTGIGSKTSALAIDANQVVRLTNHMRMAEQANVGAPTATFARWWVRNDVPNVPMFTDDDDVDHQLAYGTVGVSEGEFTATLNAGTGTITLNTAFDTLAWTKVDRVVHVQGQVRVLSVSTPGAALSLVTLPFTPATLTELADITRFAVWGETFSAVADEFKMGEVSFASTTMIIKDSDGSALASEVIAGTEFFFNFSYIAV